ncbi:MAG: hypothetical protein IAE81_20505 [Caldilineaceae bacterium]|nr:hypothetical protein [Caldilineaceae bacterium]
MELILQPWSGRTIGDTLQLALRGDFGTFVRLDAAIAFVKRSGVQHIASDLRDFVSRQGRVRLVVGIDQNGTSIEGLSDLLAAVGGQGEIWIVHSSDAYVTFHPKLYLFKGEDKALLLVGSGNLTQGGLYANDEAATVQVLDLRSPDDLQLLEQIEAALNRWCETEHNTAYRLDTAFLQALVDNGYVVPEQQTRTEGDVPVPDSDVDSAADKSNRSSKLFGRGLTRRRPPRPVRSKPAARSDHSGSSIPQQSGRIGFVMTLMRTDAGVGQATPGAPRRSPEVFIPLKARNTNPEFWGWRDSFVEDQAEPGKWDRRGVVMRLNDATIHVNMMTWPVKHDFRLRSEALRSAGQVGDILCIEQSDDAEYSYRVAVIPSDAKEYTEYFQRCTESVGGRSQKKWGYYVIQ